MIKIRFEGKLRINIAVLLVTQILSEVYAQERPSDLQIQINEDLVFYSGDGLGTNRVIDLRTNGEIITSIYGCTGDAEVFRGKYRVKGQGIIVDVDGDLRENIEFILLVWRERTYLIPRNELVGFCNEINLGFEPRETSRGQFLLRESDWGKHAGTRAELPDDFQKFVLPAPVFGKVIACSPRTGRMLIDLGTDNGVFPKMLLNAAGDKNYPASQIVVETVQKSDCVARRSNETDSFTVGQIVSSSFFEVEKK